MIEKERMNMMNNAWQLGVIDYDLTDFKQYPKFYSQIQAERHNGVGLDDGDIVYIVSTSKRTIHSLGELFSELANRPIYQFGVTFADVWNVKKKRYGWAMQEFIRPILTEKDVIEVELKFGISLKDYI